LNTVIVNLAFVFICDSNVRAIGRRAMTRHVAEPASAARATAAITTFRILYRLGPSLFSNRSAGDCNPVASRFRVGRRPGRCHAMATKGVLDRGATAPQPRPQLKASKAQIRVICARAIE
jgi:hypothetical protein